MSELFNSEINEKLNNSEIIIDGITKNLNDLNKEITDNNLNKAKLLINKGKIEQVAIDIKTFDKHYHNEIANLIINKNGTKILLKYLHNFEDLDINIAKKLMDNHGDIVAKCIHSFNKQYHNEIAKGLINYKYKQDFMDHINNFTELDSNIANILIKKNESKFIINHLKNFKNLDFNIAKKLIKSFGMSVIADINSFDKQYHNEIAKLIVNDYYYSPYIGYMAEHLDHFEGLDFYIAEKLIKKKLSKYVIEHISSFNRSDHDNIINTMVSNGDEIIIASYLKNFKGLNFDIAGKLIKKGYYMNVIKNIKSFNPIYHNDIAHKLISDGHCGLIISNLKDFEGLDTNIAKKLIENKHINIVVECQYSFNSDAQKYISRIL